MPTLRLVANLIVDVGKAYVTQEVCAAKIGTRNIRATRASIGILNNA